AVWAPAEPPEPPPGGRRRRPSQNQGRLFSLHVPDADQTVGGALGESLAGRVPRYDALPPGALSLRESAQVLVRKRAKVEPLSAAAVGLLVLGKPVGEQIAHVPQAGVFPPRLLGQVHLRVIEILSHDLGLVVGPVPLLLGLLFLGLSASLLLLRVEVFQVAH